MDEVGGNSCSPPKTFEHNNSATTDPDMDYCVHKLLQMKDAVHVEKQINPIMLAKKGKK